MTRIRLPTFPPAQGFFPSAGGLFSHLKRGAVIRKELSEAGGSAPEKLLYVWGYGGSLALAIQPLQIHKCICTPLRHTGREQGWPQLLGRQIDVPNLAPKNLGHDLSWEKSQEDGSPHRERHTKNGITEVGSGIGHELYSEG